MQGLFHTLPNIPLAEIRLSLDMASDTQLEHRRGHPRKPFGAVLHAPEDFLLLIIQRTQGFTQKESAIAAGGSQGCAEIMYRTCQEVGSILIVFLKLKV